MEPPQRHRYTTLAGLFVVGAVALGFFTELITGRLGRMFDQAPGWVFVIGLGVLLAVAVTVTVLYERLSEHPAPEPRSRASGSGHDTPAVLRSPSRRTVMRAGVGAVGLVTAVTGAPWLYSWVSSRLSASTSAGWESVTLDAEEDDLYSVAFSPDGGMVAAGFYSGTVIVWDIESLKRRILRAVDSLNAVVFSSDGKTLAGLLFGGGGCGEDGPWPVVALWDIATQTELPSIEGRGEWPGSIAFSPDGTTLACGYEAGCGNDEAPFVALWNIADLGAPERIARLDHPGDSLKSVAFSPDGKVLASCCTVEDEGTERATVRLWDVETHEVITTLIHPGFAFRVAFSPDGRLLASAGEVMFDDIYTANILVWDPVTWENIATLTPKANVASSVAFSPDGDTLVAGLGYDGDGRRTGAVELWSVAERARIGTLDRPGGGFIRSVAMSLDGQTIVAGAEDGVVRLWTKPTREQHVSR